MFSHREFLVALRVEEEHLMYSCISPHNLPAVQRKDEIRHELRNEVVYRWDLRVVLSGRKGGARRVLCQNEFDAAARAHFTDTFFPEGWRGVP